MWVEWPRRCSRPTHCGRDRTCRRDSAQSIPASITTINQPTSGQAVFDAAGNVHYASSGPVPRVRNRLWTPDVVE